MFSSQLSKTVPKFPVCLFDEFTFPLSKENTDLFLSSLQVSFSDVVSNLGCICCLSSVRLSSVHCQPSSYVKACRLLHCSCVLEQTCGWVQSLWTGLSPVRLVFWQRRKCDCSNITLQILSQMQSLCSLRMLKCLAMPCLCFKLWLIDLVSRFCCSEHSRQVLANSTNVLLMLA